MKHRRAEVDRTTKETKIAVKLDLDSRSEGKISTGIPFFDHMLSLLSAHGLFKLSISAKGDIDVDYHHTVEDVGIVFGDALHKALGDRTGINRYGHAVTPMDDALTAVTIDLSNRPYLVYNAPEKTVIKGNFDTQLTKEFFRAFATRGGMTVHINVLYGENDHHVMESMFKATGRALKSAIAFNKNVSGVRSTKGFL
ncbi:MAG: imidazoleglycerol-phosphate dehydratase HisB [Desulfobacterales bacterium]